MKYGFISKGINIWWYSQPNKSCLVLKQETWIVFLKNLLLNSFYMQLVKNEEAMFLYTGQILPTSVGRKWFHLYSGAEMLLHYKYAHSSVPLISQEGAISQKGQNYRSLSFHKHKTKQIIWTAEGIRTAKHDTNCTCSTIDLTDISQGQDININIFAFLSPHQEADWSHNS